jgi:hypothetical protein
MEEGDSFNLFLSVSPLNPGDKKEIMEGTAGKGRRKARHWHEMGET